jgi:hypothetical protein
MLYSAFVNLLEQHGVREPVLEVLLWEKPMRSLMLLSAGTFAWCL